MLIVILEIVTQSLDNILWKVIHVQQNQYFIHLVQRDS